MKSFIRRKILRKTTFYGNLTWQEDSEFFFWFFQFCQFHLKMKIYTFHRTLHGVNFFRQRRFDPKNFISIFTRQKTERRKKKSKKCMKTLSRKLSSELSPYTWVKLSHFPLKNGYSFFPSHPTLGMRIKNRREEKTSPPRLKKTQEEGKKKIKNLGKEKSADWLETPSPLSTVNPAQASYYYAEEKSPFPAALWKKVGGLQP